MVNVELSPKMRPEELRQAALSIIAELRRERGRLGSLLVTQGRVIERLNAEVAEKTRLVIEVRARNEDLLGAIRELRGQIGEGPESGKVAAESGLWQEFGMKVASDLLELLEGLRGLKGTASPLGQGGLPVGGGTVPNVAKGHRGRPGLTGAKSCSVEWCGEPARAKGWCWRHLARWKTHGDPLKGMRTTDGLRRGNSHNGVVMREGPEGVWNPV